MKKSNFLASFGKNTQRKSSVKFWKKELHQKKHTIIGKNPTKKAVLYSKYILAEKNCIVNDQQR